MTANELRAHTAARKLSRTKQTAYHVLRDECYEVDELGAFFVASEDRLDLLEPGCDSLAVYVDGRRVE